MITFEELRREFAKHSLKLDRLNDYFILLDPSFCFRLVGCCLTLKKRPTELSSNSPQTITKYVTYLDPSSPTQIVRSVLDGIDVLTEIDKGHELINDAWMVMDKFKEKYTRVKFIILVIAIPDQPLRYRLCFDINTESDTSDLCFTFDPNTGNIRFIDILSINSIPSHSVVSIIYESYCSLVNIDSIFTDIYLPIFRASYLYNSLPLSINRECKLDNEAKENLVKPGEHINIVNYTTAWSPLYKFYLRFNKKIKEVGHYYSILSPTEEDQPVRFYAETDIDIINYSISGLTDRGVHNVTKFIGDNIFNQHTESQIDHIKELASDDLGGDGVIVTDIVGMSVLVDGSNGVSTYKHTRTVKYLYEDLPSSISFLLETVLGRDGKEYYNIISDDVDSLYGIPIGNIKDICNSFVLSRYGYVSNFILSNI